MCVQAVPISPAVLVIDIALVPDAHVQLRSPLARNVSAGDRAACRRKARRRPLPLSADALNLKQFSRLSRLILRGTVMLARLCIGLAALVLSASGGIAADLTVGFVTSLSGPGASIGIPYEKGILAAHAFASKVGDNN